MLLSFSKTREEVPSCLGGGGWAVGVGRGLGSSPVRAPPSEPTLGAFPMKASWPQSGCSSSWPAPTLSRRRRGRRGEGIGEKAMRKKRDHLVPESQRFPELPPNACSDQARGGASRWHCPPGEPERRLLRKLRVLCYPAGRRGGYWL